MDWGFVVMIMLAGLGTFLIRYLPLRLRSRSGRAGGPDARSVWSRLFSAIGPAGIVALLVVSLISLVRPEQPWIDGVPVLTGLAGVLLGRRWPGGIAGSTLAGVLAYGLAAWAMGA